VLCDGAPHNGFDTVPFIAIGNFTVWWKSCFRSGQRALSYAHKMNICCRLDGLLFLSVIATSTNPIHLDETVFAQLAADSIAKLPTSRNRPVRAGRRD
jgi:hypothetical protein